MPPASMAMLEMVKRSSMDRTALPVNSRDWYRLSTPIRPIQVEMACLPLTMGWSTFQHHPARRQDAEPQRASGHGVSVEPMPVEEAPALHAVQV